MKKMFMTIIAVVMLPLAAMAQMNINKVWQQVVDGAIGTQTGLDTESGVDADGKKWSYEFYSFETKSGKSVLDRVKAAFKADRKNAYSVFVKSATANEEGLGNTLNVKYGKGAAKSIEFGKRFSNGKDNNCEVQFFRDSRDSCRRTAYALVWFNSADGNSTTCYMYRIYGLDPQRTHTTSTYDGGRGQSLTMRTDGTIVKFNGLTNNSVIIQPQEYKPVSTDNIQDSADFMVMFNTLHSDFVRIVDLAGRDQTLYGNAIAKPINGIITLCKRCSKLLSAEERRLCVNVLTDMKTKAKDNGVKTMLDVAASYMK